jgi:hypothetical protein
MADSKISSTHGFAPILCPCCLQENTVTLDLDSLDKVRCTSCDKEISISEIENLVGVWGRVLRWIKMAPVNE